MELIKTYLIVDNHTNEVLDFYDVENDARVTLSLAKQCIKERYPEDRIVRAVCIRSGGWQSSWSCGKTFRDAESNYKKGITHNWEDF